MTRREPVVRVHDLDRTGPSRSAGLNGDRVEEHDGVAAVKVAAFERLDSVVCAALVVLTAGASDVVITKRAGGGVIDRDIAACWCGQRAGCTGTELCAHDQGQDYRDQ